jgi:hypothetical protein
MYVLYYVGGNTVVRLVVCCVGRNGPSIRPHNGPESYILSPRGLVTI